jgi:hypothetical protein
VGGQNPNRTHEVKYFVPPLTIGDYNIYIYIYHIIFDIIVQYMNGTRCSYYICQLFDKSLNEEEQIT